MKTKQPSYSCIANLGDAIPHEYGGEFVLVDRRGIYDPQVWRFEASETEGEPGEWFRYDIPQCFPCQGNNQEIGANRFHPAMPEWFGDTKSLQSAADTCGYSTAELRALLCSADPIERALGYSTVGLNFGFDNFDYYPNRMTAKEDRALCRLFLRQLAQADKWKDGIGL
jgi:hypothetical protein